MKKFVLAAVLTLITATAQADLITGQITGVFASSGTNTYSQDGVTITFTGLGPGTIDTPTFASFGNFDVTAAPGTPVALSDTFTLTVSETAPTVDSITFTATLAGLLGQTRSSGFFLFGPPLSQTLGVTNTVTILSADQGSFGRINLGVPSFPNASITGSITSVPEPSSLALLGIGLTCLIGLKFRRR